MAQALQQDNRIIAQTISPIDNSIFIERSLHDASDINEALDSAKMAQKSWRKLPLEERQEFLTKALEALLSKSDDIALEITKQMGRQLWRMLYRLSKKALSAILSAKRWALWRLLRRGITRF